MSTNPDNSDYQGLGPQSKKKVKDPDTGEEVELDMPQRYLVPMPGMLRFVTRGVPTENPQVLKSVRILQQYQWCREAGDHGWYDIPLVETE